MRLHREINLIEKIVLVDGLSRTGKSMLGPIFASFEQVEIERVEAIFEYIPFLDSIRKIERDAAVELLLLEADTKLYESRIGRNTNFRIADHSGVFNNPFKWEYFKRLFQKGTTAVVNDVRKNKTIFQVQTHDVLGIIDPYFDAFDNKIYILEMVRDPIDLIYSWFQRGWGHRFTSDPLSFTLTIKTESGIAPWYDMLIDYRYNSLKPMDRIIMIIDALQQRSLKKYNELGNNRKRQILWIVFEDFVTKPEESLLRIESFVGTKRTKYTRQAMKKANCPRRLNMNDHKKKEKVIKSHASPEIFNKIESMYEWYKKMKEISEIGS